MYTTELRDIKDKKLVKNEDIDAAVELNIYGPDNCRTIRRNLPW